MTNSTGAGAFVAATLEDAVKAGIAGAGVGTVGTIAVNHSPLDVAVGFLGAFIASLVLSLVSQPFGDKSTNHVVNVAVADAQAVLEAVIRDVAASQRPLAAPVAANGPVSAYPPAETVPSPQTPISVQPGVPGPGA